MEAPSALADRVRRAGIDAGLDVVGICTAEPFLDTRAHLQQRKSRGLHAGMQFTYRDPVRATDPGRALPGARALVVGARSYHRAEPTATPTDSAPGPAGAVARYSWIDHYRPLRAALGAVADELVREGWRAKVVADDNALVDRAAAHRAGLGWFGKNTNLLLHDRGSEFVLGSVVTDAPLPPTAGEPAAHDGCGACARCLPACPTGALVAPGVLDAGRCLAWLVQAEGTFPREHRAALGARIYGCDECQDACPPNRLEIRRRPPQPAEPGAEPAVSLLALLAEDDDDVLLDRYGRWYIARRQARHLRRNALVALGNVADGRDPAVLVVLERCLSDDDPLVRGHAVWAAARVGRADLLAALARSETDPSVRAELAALPEPREA